VGTCMDTDNESGTRLPGASCFAHCNQNMLGHK